MGASPFPHNLAGIRDAARRLAAHSAAHQSDVRHYLEEAEAAGNGAVADAVRRLCVSARTTQLAVEQLVVDLGGVSVRPAGPSGRPSVLIADDYEDSRDWLAMLVGNAGFSVSTACDGLEALLAAYELRPVVVVIDLMMPVLDGIEAARLIKSIEQLRGTRVIAYTARTPPPEVNDVFTAVIPKPSPPEVVVETVKRWAAA
jgi:two-component system, cell cycle response regulator DivK